jgi:hypothetical protein
MTRPRIFARVDFEHDVIAVAVSLGQREQNLERDRGQRKEGIRRDRGSGSHGICLWIVLALGKSDRGCPCWQLFGPPTSSSVNRFGVYGK